MLWTLCPAATRDDSIAMFRRFALEISAETAALLRRPYFAGSWNSLRMNCLMP
jgi:hypothetical protein